MPEPLTQADVREIITYDPATGAFDWVTPGAGRPSVNGFHIGSITDYGHHVICIKQRRYKAHRLAWVYMTGVWPSSEIDHIDRNPRNNRWDNLRGADHGENMLNRSVQSNNKCGLKGVHWAAKDKAWAASIRKNGKKYWLGYFQSAEEAARAYDKAAVKHHGAFAATNAGMGLLPGPLTPPTKENVDE